MSSQKFKLHFASSIIQTLKEIKNFILPAIIVFAANGFNLTFNSFESIIQIVPVVVIVVIFLYTIVSGIVKWITFTYWIEDSELKSEYGFLFKHKRYIPLERIQSLNSNEGIIHRIFNVVQISIETAGGSAKKSEVELTAITKQAAIELEQLIQQHRKADVSLEMEEVKQARNIIYRINNRDLILLATTSNSIMIVLASIGAVISQFSEFIPFEKISKQFAFLFEYGFITIAILVCLTLLIAWSISVAMTYLAYYSFAISLDHDQVEITRGLLNKKKISIPIQKIQAIKVVENPLRQLFGYANVTIENAGTVMQSSTETKVVLLPFIKKDMIQEIVELIDPEFSMDMTAAYKSPTYALPLFYRKYLYIGVAIAIVGVIFVSPYFLIALIVGGLLAALGIAQHKSACFELQGHNVKVQYRVVNRVFYFVKRNKIQACELTQNFFQKRLNAQTGKVHVMGNAGGVTIKIPHQGQETAQELMNLLKKDV